jgi:very-short-patch-repair endonuclease
MDKINYKTIFTKDLMHLQHQYAKELRHTETEAEKTLWAFLRNRKMKGKKFRRPTCICKLYSGFLLS